MQNTAIAKSYRRSIAAKLWCDQQFYRFTSLFIKTELPEIIMINESKNDNLL